MTTESMQLLRLRYVFVYFTVSKNGTPAFSIVCYHYVQYNFIYITAPHFRILRQFS